VLLLCRLQLLLLLGHCLLKHLHLLLERRPPLLLARLGGCHTSSVAAPAALQHNSSRMPLHQLPHCCPQPPHLAVVLIPLTPYGLDRARCCVRCLHTTRVRVKLCRLLRIAPRALDLARCPVLRAQLQGLYALLPVLLTHHCCPPRTLQERSCLMLPVLLANSRCPPSTLQQGGCLLLC
jgi:hypothetical protein